MIKRGRPRVPWLVAIPLMVLPLSLFIKILQWSYQEVSGIYASKKWSTTSGIVVSSYLRTEREKRGYVTQVHVTNYTPEVKYKYRIHGQIYTCEKVFFGQYGSGDRLSAKNTLKRYPTGKRVLVYYDPENPQNAVLEPGVGNLTGLFFGTAVALVGLAIIVQFFRGPPLRQDSTIEEE